MTPATALQEQPSPQNAQEFDLTPLCFNPDLMADIAEVTETLKAMAHDQRLMIICILTEGSKSVRHIEKITGLRQSVVSQQLARLRSANLVSTRREGKSVYYFIASERVRNIIHLLRGEFRYNRSLTAEDVQKVQAVGRDEVFLRQ